MKLNNIELTEESIKTLAKEWATKEKYVQTVEELLSLYSKATDIPKPQIFQIG